MANNSRESSSRSQTIITFVVYLIAFSCCAYQSTEICIEYFKYPTITRFQILDYLPVMPTPKVIVSFPLPQVRQNSTVKDIFASVYKSTGVLVAKMKDSVYSFAVAKPFYQSVNQSERLFDIREAILRDRYLLSISPKRDPKLSPSTTFLDGMPIYNFQLRTNLAWNSPLMDSDVDRPRVYLTSMDSDIEGTKSKFPLTINCYSRISICIARLIYSVKITKLSPPPYDTDCHDYEGSRFTSRDNCYSECLNSFTREHGSLIESNVIWENKYGRSDLKLIPWHLRYPRTFGTKKAFNTTVMSKYDFKHKVSVCESVCKRRDCESKVFIPQHNILVSGGYYSKKRVTTRTLVLEIYPPRNAIIVVTSQPKTTFLDFFVYLTIVFSLWLGFCPLKLHAMLPNLIAKIKNQGKKRKPRAINRLHQLLKFLWILFIYVLSLGGFALQSVDICIKYFQYPTITYVTIASSVKTAVPPKAILEICHPSRVGESIGSVFNEQPDTTQLFPLGMRYPPPNPPYPIIRFTSTCKRAECKNFDVKRFYKNGNHFIEITPKNVTPIDLTYLADESMYEVHFKSNLWDKRRCNFHIKIYLIPQNSDVEGIQRTPVAQSCGNMGCAHFLTYSLKVTKSLPPPYDTKCREYRETSLTSSENCWSRCLSNFTEQFGLIIESNVMYKSQYGNSTLKLIPLQMRYMDNIEALTADDIWKQYHKTVAWKKSTSHSISVSDELKHKVSEILPSFKNVWINCQTQCRSACYIETLTPKIFMQWRVMPFLRKERNKIHRELRLETSVYPPDDIIITVEARKGISLLDFIVYTASCFGFWFGFCPFGLANNGIQSWISFIQKNRDLSRKLVKKLRKSLSIISLRVFLYFVILLGCCYQEEQIMRDYFEYQTTTLVTMEASLPKTLAPRLVLSLHYTKTSNESYSYVGWQLKDVFKAIKDKTRILDASVKNDKQDNPISMKTFLTQGVYGISFQPIKLIKYSSEELYAKGDPLYQLRFQSNQFPLYCDASMPVIMKSIDSDDEELSSIFYVVVGTSQESRVHMTYSTKINQLAPYPYDTNCRDYKRIGFTSKQNCFVQCLNSFMIKKGYILETSYIPREQYENSTLIIIPKFMRYLAENKPVVDNGFIAGEIPKIDQYNKARANVSKGFYDSLKEMLPSYRKHWFNCNQSCSFEDCYFESVYPHVIYLYHDFSLPYYNVNNVTIYMYPSNDQVITVTSTPKLQLLDFVVFSLSVISFWFGFSPLDIPEFWSALLCKASRKRKRKRRRNPRTVCP